MSPFKRGGMYYVEWQRKDVGRIVRSAAKDARTAKRISAMLDELYVRGHYGILDAVKHGVLTLGQVYDAYRREQLGTLPTAETMLPLEATMLAWAVEVSGRAASNRRMGVYRLIRHQPEATLADIPALLRLDRQQGQAPAFNRARAQVLRFLKDRLGKLHGLYHHALAVEALPEKAEGRGQQLTVVQALDVRDELDEPLGHAWWAMCVTGMIMSELWGRWELQKDRVRIYGQKTAARNRVVPLVEPIVHPDFNRRHLSSALTALGVESYAARKTYAGWLEQCGFLRSFRKLYLGHATQDTTDLYEMANREGLWVEHGAALRRLLQQTSQQKKSGRIA